MARQRKTPKPKQPSYQKILRETDTLEVYDALDHCLDTYRKDLKAESCRIALAFRYGLKKNKDSQLKLGNLKKVGELDREYAAYDWIIVLNQDTWKLFDNDQRHAVMHHYLCGIAIAEDQNGNTKKDARNRTMFRGRKPDIVEYGEVINHHGCYLADLENFVATAMRSVKPPSPTLLDGLVEPSANGVHHAEPSTNGYHPAPGTNGDGKHAEEAAVPMASAARRTPKRPAPRPRGKARAKSK